MVRFRENAASHKMKIEVDVVEFLSKTSFSTDSNTPVKYKYIMISAGECIIFMLIRIPLICVFVHCYRTCSSMYNACIYTPLGACILG